MQFNITENTNTLLISESFRKLIITDSNNTSLTINQPVTNLVTVVSPGPIGPIGPVGSGSGGIADTGSLWVVGGNSFTGSNSQSLGTLTTQSLAIITSGSNRILISGNGTSSFNGNVNITGSIFRNDIINSTLLFYLTSSGITSSNTITFTSPSTLTIGSTSINGSSNILFFNQNGIIQYSQTTSGTATGAIRINNANTLSGTNGSTQTEFGVGTGFAPASGTSPYNTILVNPTINSAGTGIVKILNISSTYTAHLGGVIGIDYNPITPQNITGSHLAIRAQSGRVLIGTGSEASASLHVSGGGIFTTNTAVGINNTGSAMFQVRGTGTTTGQTLLIENSAQTSILSIIDAGSSSFNGNTNVTGSLLVTRVSGVSSSQANVILSIVQNGSSSNNYGIIFKPGINDGNNLGIYASSTSALRLGFNNAYIESSGGRISFGSIPISSTYTALVNNGLSSYAFGISGSVSSSLSNAIYSIIDNSEYHTGTDTGSAGFIGSIFIDKFFRIRSASLKDVSLLHLTPTYDQTTATGSFIGIRYAPTLTSLSGSHYFISASSGKISTSTSSLDLPNDNTLTRILAQSSSGEWAYVTSSALFTSNSLSSSAWVIGGNNLAGSTTQSLGTISADNISIIRNNTQQLGIGNNRIRIFSESDGVVLITGSTTGPRALVFGGTSNWGSGSQYTFQNGSNSNVTTGSIIGASIGGNTMGGNGNIDIINLRLNSNISQSGTASGSISLLKFENIITNINPSSSLIGIDYNPSITSITGSHYAAIFRTGRVGIGATAPSSSLHVSGGGIFTTNLTVGINVTGSAIMQVRGIGTSTETSLLIENSAQSPLLSILDNGSSSFNGNVVIGASTGPTISRTFILAPTATTIPLWISSSDESDQSTNPYIRLQSSRNVSSGVLDIYNHLFNKLGTFGYEFRGLPGYAWTFNNPGLITSNNTNGTFKISGSTFSPIASGSVSGIVMSITAVASMSLSITSSIFSVLSITPTFINVTSSGQGHTAIGLDYNPTLSPFTGSHLAAWFRSGIVSGAVFQGTSFTGSLLGTSATASYVNPLTQSVFISGTLIITGSANFSGSAHTLIGITIITGSTNIVNVSGNGGNLTIGTDNSSATSVITKAKTMWDYDITNTGGRDVFRSGSNIALSFANSNNSPLAMMHSSLTAADVTITHAVFIGSGGVVGTYRGGLLINASPRINFTTSGSGLFISQSISFDPTNPLTGSWSGIDILNDFSPNVSSKTGITYIGVRIRPIINITGPPTGSVIGIDYNPTITTLNGANHYAALFRTGRVGIGATAPSSSLHVSGGGIFTTNTAVGINNTGSAMFQVRGTGTTTGQTLLVENSAQTSILSIIDAGTSSFNGNVNVTGSIVINNVANGTIGIISSSLGSGSNQIILFNTSSINGVFFEYLLVSSSNTSIRGGNINGMWINNTTSYAETNISSIGNNNDYITCSVILSSSFALLNINIPTNNSWSFKGFYKTI